MTRALAQLVLVLLPLAASAQEPDPHHKQHKMPHAFKGPERWAKQWDNPERDAWQKPAAVIASLKLGRAARVADLGAGTGYFTVRLARAVPQGFVWGVDVEPQMVRYLGQRAAREGLKNVRGVVASASDARLPEPVDLVFVCDTYHHIGDRVAYFKRLAPRLKPGGRLVVVDFKAGKLPVGPPEGSRVAPPALERELTAAGYRRLALDEKTLPYQYIASYGR